MTMQKRNSSLHLLMAGAGGGGQVEPDLALADEEEGVCFRRVAYFETPGILMIVQSVEQRRGQHGGRDIRGLWLCGRSLISLKVVGSSPGAICPPPLSLFP